MGSEGGQRLAAAAPVAAEPQPAAATARAFAVSGETARVQGLAGNLAIGRVLGAAGIRRKPTVSQPGDPDEEEADRVADAVVSRSVVSPITWRSSPAIRRQCACAGGTPCAHCEEEDVRAKLATAPAAAGAAGAQRAVDAVASGGAPLSPAIRSAWEPQFRRDFSDVRVHTGGPASDAARTIGARAYAVGPNIAFAPGEFRPDHREGRRLLAHELTHVAQSGHTVRRQPGAPATPAPPDPSTVKAAADVIVDALDGYTSGTDSENIVKQFRGRDAAFVLAIVTEVEHRGGSYNKTSDEMFDWLLGDLTEENRRELRQILIKSRIPEAERLVVNEIKDRLEGYTSEDDSSEIVALFSGSVGPGIDALLTGLEKAMNQDRDTMRDQLFGDLYRVSAERLRQLFFAQGGTIALSYATARTARKIMDLLEGYTSHSDSTDIVWNFFTTPVELRALVHVRLDEMCRRSRNGESSDDALMHDMDASDYERLRAMGGLALKPYKDTRSTAEKAVAAVEWVEVVAEWTTCGVIGIATGLASAIWDIVKGIKDIVVGVWDLIWSLIYLVSFGAAGSENWLKVKTFFTGIGNLFTDPGKVWDQFWEEQALEFHTIEGPLADCRRAEFWVRKIISALVNVALIFVAGYGVVKGVVSGVRAVAEGAELAEIIGVRGVIWVAGRLASRRIARFVGVTGEIAAELLKVIRAPAALLTNISARIRVVLLAADDVGYWRYLRQQAGVAVDVAADTAAKQLEGERRFWAENSRYWKERGLMQQAREQELLQDYQAVEEHLDAKEQPDPPSLIADLKDDTQQLDGESADLHATVTGKADTQATPPAPPQPPAAPASIEQMIAEELEGFQPDPVQPLDPASFGQPPRRVVSNLRDIALDEIPPERRGYYEAAYPRYQQRRLAEIARGIRPNRQPMLRDDYVRFRYGRDTGVLVQGPSGPIDLSRPGVIDQLAGHVLEKVVDARLPGSSNTTSFPNPFGEPVIPDHLPPGQSSVFLDSQGRKAAAGQRFSARFVGDSKYRSSIPINEQTRGFVNLAKFSDEETLVFYVRWQEGFPPAESLTFDPALGGRVLPVRPWNADIVSPALRDMAGNRGVKIRLVTDPAWK